MLYFLIRKSGQEGMWMKAKVRKVEVRAKIAAGECEVKVSTEIEELSSSIYLEFG
jgi:hypothetical protein